MKKISKNNISKSFVEKAVVLGIVLVFLFGAFIPAVNSQSRSIKTSSGLIENEHIEVDIEESVVDDDQEYLDEGADREMDTTEDQLIELNQPLDETRGSRGHQSLFADDLCWNTSWHYRM